MSVRVWVPKGCITVKWVFWDYELLRSIKAKVFANDAETYEPLTFLPTIFNKRGTCILASSLQAAANSQTSTAQTLLEPQKPGCNMRYLCLASNSNFDVLNVLLHSHRVSCWWDLYTEIPMHRKPRAFPEAKHSFTRTWHEQHSMPRSCYTSHVASWSWKLFNSSEWLHSRFRRKEPEYCFIGLTSISKWVAFWHGNSKADRMMIHGYKVVQEPKRNTTPKRPNLQRMLWNYGACATTHFFPAARAQKPTCKWLSTACTCACSLVTTPCTDIRPTLLSFSNAKKVCVWHHDVWCCECMQDPID